MKIKHLISTSALVAVAVACASATAPNYTVTVPLTEDEDDMVAYIVDFDSGDKIEDVYKRQERIVICASACSKSRHCYGCDVG